MNDFVRLSCPACGGHLEITKSINQFVCAHCGTEHVVNRGGGIISLQPLVHGLSQIQIGTDRTADELAVQRMRLEIDEMKKAWAELEQLRVAKVAEIQGIRLSSDQVLGMIIIDGVIVAGALLTLVGNLLTGGEASASFIVVIISSMVGVALYFTYLDKKTQLTKLGQNQSQIMDQIGKLESNTIRTQAQLQRTLTRLQNT